MGEGADPAPSPVRSYGATLLGPPSIVGALVALVCWLASLVPTLLPRSWASQAVISAVCIGIGYLIGTLVGTVVRLLRRRPRSEGPGRLPWRVLGPCLGVLVVLALVLWQRSQDGQRDLVGMAHEPLPWIVAMLVATVAIVALLVAVGRSIGFVVMALDRVLARLLPRWLTHTTTVVLVVLGVWVLSTDVVERELLHYVNDRFGAADEGTAEGVRRPGAATVSGSPESLVRWSTLGSYGRSFVAGATSERRLRAFAGDDAAVQAPVRAYTGLDSAPDARARARLAVRDLRRAGGFDREVLVVWTSTGTGWVDPDAARALELLHAGDTAIVSMQYSFLPSWISFLVDKDEAKEAGVALERAVHRSWSQLPEDDRPRLIVFGESLGSYGSEAAFAEPEVGESVDRATRRSDGVLWVGPTNDNPVWEQVLAARDPSTPSWLPVYDDGRRVRFQPEPTMLTPDRAWPGVRVLYLHHPSDPVGLWNVQTLWRPQPWSERPVGYDVPSSTRWFPVVSFVQVVADLIAGFSAPPGHGHDYDNGFAAAWATVVPPQGWTPADTARLERHLG